MHVRIDQARHEDASRAIEDVHLFVDRQRTWRKPGDYAIGHQEIMTLQQRLGIAVKDARIAEKNRHVGSLSQSRYCVNRVTRQAWLDATGPTRNALRYRLTQNQFRKGHRPSRTAEYMALFRAVETAADPRRRLFEDPYAAALLTGRLKALAGFAGLPVAGRLANWFLDLGWPCTRSSAVVRTRLIDDLLRQAIRGGARQALLLGAGFDSRPYRLEELRGVPLFEVDHPSTQTAKRQRLQVRLGRLPANVRFVPVDFEKDDLEATLLAAGFDTGAPTVAVWEGVVSYLTPAAVDQNFCMLARMLAQGSELIFSYVHRGALDGSVAFREARRWKSSVRSTGEPFIFGFDPAELADYLRPRGFALVRDVSTAEAAKLYCEPLHRSEPGSELYRIAAARRAAL
jgi:methyltransferase (TIGR00027 family)